MWIQWHCGLRLVCKNIIQCENVCPSATCTHEPPAESKIRVLDTVRDKVLCIRKRSISSVPPAFGAVSSPEVHLKPRNMWLIFLKRTFRAIDSYWRSQGIISERLLPQRPHGLTERHVRKGHLITWNIQRPVRGVKDGAFVICQLSG